VIKLVFTRVRETFIIEIQDKVIFYKDKKFPDGIQFMPKDPELKMKVIKSRNRMPPEVLQWIESANSGKNLEEYNSASDDEALVPIIIKDAKINGGVFQKRIEN
jgi:hypothetical protein